MNGTGDPERWVTISSFPAYEISDLGRIRNRSTGNIRKCLDNGNGYLQTNFCVDGIRTRVAIHALVAEAFLDTRQPEQTCIRHRDGNKGNNRATNLSYGTVQENTDDNKRLGIKVGRPLGRKNAKNHSNSLP